MLYDLLRDDRNAEEAKAGGLVSRSSPGIQHSNPACGNQPAGSAKRALTLSSQVEMETHKIHN